MAKFHINPKTGNPGKCNAVTKCPFGGDEVHYPSAENARAAYELSMGPVVKEKLSRRDEEEAAEEAADALYQDLMQSGGQAGADFKSIMTTVTTEDIAYGVEQAARHLVMTGGSKWKFKTVMDDVRKTEKQVAIYEKRLRQEVGRDPKLRELALKRAAHHAKRDAWARAFERNVAIDPAIEAEFDAIWQGNARGKSRKELIEEGEDLQAMKQNFKEGKVKPSEIVGTGLVNPRKAAEEYLDNRLIEIARAVQTEGRSESVNVSNALFNAARKGVNP